MAKWLASALPVADMYATAQYVMAQTVPLMRRLAFYDQFIEDYRGSQVYAHWCVYKRHRPLWEVYERTGKREVGCKRLMPVCRRSLQRNSATDDDIDGGISTPDAASIKIVMPVWRYRS